MGERKKIGILTFHRAINYGAFMQCYSLVNRINKDFPEYSVEVIDYSQKRLEINNTTDFKTFILGNKNYRYTWKQIIIHILLFLRNPKCLKDLEKLKNAFALNRAKLPLSEYQVVSDEEKELLEEMKGKYDAVVVGSDCVWEFITYSFPNPYFLNGDIAAPKLSYAASSDRMYFPKVEKEKVDYINEAMKGLNYIGIRDVATENFLQLVNEKLELHHNCDPTLLLELEEVPVDMEKLKEKLRSKGIDLSKPITGIMGDNNIGNLVYDIFKGQYQVVAVYTRIKKSDCYLEGLTPFEWSRVFSLFSITFTRYFHGTILSLKMEHLR